jgi:hypothetical protein
MDITLALDLYGQSSQCFCAILFLSTFQQHPLGSQFYGHDTTNREPKLTDTVTPWKICVPPKLVSKVLLYSCYVSEFEQWYMDMITLSSRVVCEFCRCCCWCRARHAWCGLVWGLIDYGGNRSVTHSVSKNQACGTFPK